MKIPSKIAPKHVKKLYHGVCQWLEIFLKDRFQQAEIDIHTLPHIQISRFLRTYNKAIFPQSGLPGISKLMLWNLSIIQTNQRT